MVSVLAFYSNDLSWTPAEVYNFSVNSVRTKLNKNEAGVSPLKTNRLDRFLN